MSQREYTEDETFDALRRIPQGQVREKLDEFGLWFEDYRESYYSALAYNKRMKFWNPIKRLFGFGTYHADKRDPLFEQDMEEKLKGTGWTIESYAAEVDKPILERRAVIQAVKMKRRIYLLCAYVLILALGVQIAVTVGAAWTQGLVTGVNLANVIIASYPWIADKFWPYPSYRYRYE